MEEVDLVNSEELFCLSCLQELPMTVEYFHRDKNKKHGFYPVCKVCRGGEYGISKPNVVLEKGENERYCKSCNRLLPLKKEYFYRDSSRKKGFEYICKDCQGESGFGVHHPGNIAECTTSEYKPSSSPLRELSDEEWGEIIRFFGLEEGIECVYCGDSENKMHLDHIRPRSIGGEAKVGNIAPACRSCNLSKLNKELEQWYPSQDFYDRGRMEEIKSYLTEVEANG